MQLLPRLSIKRLGTSGDQTTSLRQTTAASHSQRRDTVPDGSRAGQLSEACDGARGTGQQGNKQELFQIRQYQYRISI